MPNYELMDLGKRNDSLNCFKSNLTILDYEIFNTTHYFIALFQLLLRQNTPRNNSLLILFMEVS